MRNLSGKCSAVASVLGLGALIAIAGADADLDAQVIRPAAPVQLHEGGVAPEEIPDAFRSRVFRNPGEETPVPDVLVLKNGRKIEAYFLQAYANRLVFYFRENGRSFVREEIPRSKVSSVLYEQYVERDTTESRLIRRGRKQPVPKRNVLAGKYKGVQDRYTMWYAVFHSETNKPLPYAEDATEYGTFIIESYRTMPSGYANKTWDMGRYSLYAPKTVNNEDWVLELTEVTHSERDRTDHVSWFSGSIQDDILIVQFSPRGGFRLEWSNLSSGAWTILPQVEFQPAGGSGRSPEGGDLSPGRIRRGLGSGARVHLVSAPPTEARVRVQPYRSMPRTSALASFAPQSAARAWVASAEATPTDSLRRVFLARRTKNSGSRISSWGRPNSHWDR